MLLSDVLGVATVACERWARWTTHKRPGPVALEGRRKAVTASVASPDASTPDGAASRDASASQSTPDVTPQPAAGIFGVTHGSVVMEIGYDDDADEALSEAVESAAGSAVVDEDYDDVVDVVLLWWRDGDGDLVDALVDAIGPLTDGGVILLLTPKPGRDGHVESEDIADAAPAAGLQVTSTINAAADWTGTRLTAPRAGSRTGKNLGAAKVKTDDE